MLLFAPASLIMASCGGTGDRHHGLAFGAAAGLFAVFAFAARQGPLQVALIRRATPEGKSDAEFVLRARPSDAAVSWRARSSPPLC